MEEILCFLFCSSQIDNPSPQTHHVVYAIVFQTPAQGFGILCRFLASNYHMGSAKFRWVSESEGYISPRLILGKHPRQSNINDFFTHKKWRHLTTHGFIFCSSKWRCLTICSESFLRSTDGKLVVWFGAFGIRIGALGPRICFLGPSSRCLFLFL